MYQYQDEREQLFKEAGQKMFLRIRDNVHELLAKAGAVRMHEATRGITGLHWTQMACVDRLVELGEIKEITNHSVPGQYRVFVATHNEGP